MLSESLDWEGTFVMDASSLLVYLRGEPGCSIVQKVLGQSAECQDKIRITSVALLKVYGDSALENREQLDEVIALVEQLPFEVVPLTGNSAADAARTNVGDTPLEPDASTTYQLLKDTTGATLITADEALQSLWEQCLFVRAVGAASSRDN